MLAKKWFFFIYNFKFREIHCVLTLGEKGMSQHISFCFPAWFSRNKTPKAASVSSPWKTIWGLELPLKGFCWEMGCLGLRVFFSEWDCSLIFTVTWLTAQNRHSKEWGKVAPDYEKSHCFSNCKSNICLLFLEVSGCQLTQLPVGSSTEERFKESNEDQNTLLLLLLKRGVSGIFHQRTQLRSGQKWAFLQFLTLVSPHLPTLLLLARPEDPSRWSWCCRRPSLGIQRGRQGSPTLDWGKTARLAHGLSKAGALPPPQLAGTSGCQGLLPPALLSLRRCFHGEEWGRESGAGGRCLPVYTVTSWKDEADEKCNPLHHPIYTSVTPNRKIQRVSTRDNYYQHSSALPSRLFSKMPGFIAFSLRNPSPKQPQRLLDPRLSSPLFLLLSHHMFSSQMRTKDQKCPKKRKLVREMETENMKLLK